MSLFKKVFAMFASVEAPNDTERALARERGHQQQEQAMERLRKGMEEAERKRAERERAQEKEIEVPLPETPSEEK